MDNIGVWSRDICNYEKPIEETGGEWDEDAEVDVFSGEDR